MTSGHSLCEYRSGCYLAALEMAESWLAGPKFPVIGLAR